MAHMDKNDALKLHLFVEATARKALAQAASQHVTYPLSRLAACK